MTDWSVRRSTTFMSTMSSSVFWDSQCLLFVMKLYFLPTLLWCAFCLHATCHLSQNAFGKPLPALSPVETAVEADDVCGRLSPIWLFCIGSVVWTWREVLAVGVTPKPRNLASETLTWVSCEIGEGVLTKPVNFLPSNLQYLTSVWIHRLRWIDIKKVTAETDLFFPDRTSSIKKPDDKMHIQSLLRFVMFSSFVYIFYGVKTMESWAFYQEKKRRPKFSCNFQLRWVYLMWGLTE